MFKIIVFFAFTVAACYGAPGTYCGETPSMSLKCLNPPPLVSSEASLKCSNSDNDCASMNCIFRESKWLDGTAVDKPKLIARFNQYAKDHPEWSSVIQYTNTVCLGNELKPQGVHLNCPAYDIVQCILASFLKQASPTQWSTKAECAYPRSFAASCPVCPKDCFAPQVPIGSCNACLTLPRSP